MLAGWCGATGANGGLLDFKGFWVKFNFFSRVVEGFAMVKSEKGREVTREAWTWSDLHGLRVRVHAFSHFLSF